MARIRSAKPDFWSDPLMCSLPRDVRFTFKGIWEVCADDHGRFLADPRVIKGAVWPLDDDITLKKIEKYVLEIASRGRVLLYEEHGVRYGYVVNWSKHQKVSHPSPSRFPDPFGNPARGIPESLRSDSVQSGADRIREEGNRAERRDESVSDPDPIIRDEDRPTPPAPRVELPPKAHEFLRRFYELGSEKRRLDVTRQLYDAIDPECKGARVRPGVFAKARDLAHLEHCLAAVLGDPPRQPDAAIAIVLMKLMDPPPGPTPAEKHKANEESRVSEEEAYFASAKRAGGRWAKAHPAEFDVIRSAAAAQYAGVDAEWTKGAIEAILTQKCAAAAGFPSFEEWSETMR